MLREKTQTYTSDKRPEWNTEQSTNARGDRVGVEGIGERKKKVLVEEQNPIGSLIGTVFPSVL